MSAITTHVLDTTLGRPAGGLMVMLDRRTDDGEWETIGRGHTDKDGRLRTLYPGNDAPLPGVYRLSFDTQRYFEAFDVDGFYPEVVVVFETLAGESHYHVPLLLSPFGYSTYRGT
jgi:5-hydroxyisourate hydrolase